MPLEVPYHPFRRVGGSLEFRQLELDYAMGFWDSVSLQNDHWLGLETLHQMTSAAPMTVRFEATNCTGVTWFAEFKKFWVSHQPSAALPIDKASFSVKCRLDKIQT